MDIFILQMLYFIILYALLMNLGVLDAGQKTNKYVTTLIDAKWKDTPIILEVAEYLNDENPSYFWSFINEVSRETNQFKINGRCFKGLQASVTQVLWIHVAMLLQYYIHKNIHSEK